MPQRQTFSIASMSASVGFGFGGEQRGRRHDLAGLAEAALGDVLVEPGLLHGVEAVAVGQALDRGDRRPAHSAIGVVHGWNASPSRWLVQARHTPTPHPYFGPVTPSRSRRTQSSGMSAGAVDRRASRR